MKDFRGLSNLINFVQKRPLRLYQNIPGEVRQCSVGAIFRFNPSLNIPKLSNFHQSTPLTPYPASSFKNYLNEVAKIHKDSNTHLLELFLMKRAIHSRDTHSGQIALPGGKLDGKENDYQACIREVNEEIGLDLTRQDSFAFLGKIPMNFFAYYRNSMKMMLSVNLFFMNDPNEELTLSPTEVNHGFWFPLDSFLNPKPEDITVFEQKQPPLNFVYKNDQMWTSWLWKEVFKHFSVMRVPGFRMYDEEVLYGLTYAVVINMLNLMHTGKNVDINPLVKKMVEDLKDPKAVYEKDLFGLKSTITNKVYYYQRVKQFLQTETD